MLKKLIGPAAGVLLVAVTVLALGALGHVLQGDVDAGDYEPTPQPSETPTNTPPDVACVESVNPHGLKIPPAGSTTLPGPKGGQNEDGFYQLLSQDAEDGTAPLFVTNASGSATFGPFPSGSVVKITESEAVPSVKPMGGPNSAVAAHIKLDSDAFVFAVDSFGEFSPIIACLVPEPPK